MNDVQFNSLAALHRTPQQGLVEFIARTNAVSLNPTSVYFSPPKRVVDTYRAGTTDRNTIIRLTMADNSSSFSGSKIIVYNRLDLSDLNKLIDVTIETHLPQTTHDFIRPIFLRFGIRFEPEDILDEPLINTHDNELEAPIYEIHALPESLRWIGTLRVTHNEGRGEFKDFLTVDVLPGMNYPVAEDDGTRGSAIVYMYSHDFTTHKDVLDTYPEEYVIDDTDTALMDAIKDIDTGTGKTRWNLTEADPLWSLHGAEVIYSGINDESLPTNKSYKYVLGLRLRSDMTTPPGDMYLHYNDVFDPDRIVQ